MKKTGLFLAVSFLTFLSLGSLAMVSYKPDLKRQLTETYTNILEYAGKDKIDELPEVELVLGEIFIPPDLKSFRGRVRKDYYSKHLKAAEKNGPNLISDEDQLLQLIEGGTLVEVKSGRGYEVEKLTHSHPYMTKEAKKVLDELGQTFEALVGEGSFFTVTSGTRTAAQQKKLTRRNRNATKGNSSHSYGVSFDISYIRFNGEKSWDYKKQKQLEKVLRHFQDEDKIYVIKERKQNCFHVTVR